METYSIISSSSPSYQLHSLPSETIQMSNTTPQNTNLFTANPKSYLLQGDQRHVSSNSGLSSMVLALHSGDYYSAMTSKNSSSFKMDACDDSIDHHRNNGHEKRAVLEEEVEDGDDKGSNGVICGGNKKKVEKKMRRARVAFQTRSQVDILDDGYRWRKYGQKAVKNNNFPRSYYRCTHQGCSVKKQVQRLSKDEEFVVTTYEGIHTHPIERNNDNFEQILNQMQIYTRFC